MRTSDTSDTSTTSTTGFSSSSILSSNDDELSFLRRNPVKRWVFSLFALYSYVYSVLPIQHIIYRLSFFIRCLQVICAGFYWGDTILYPTEAKTYPVAILGSVFSRLIPVSSTTSAIQVFGWIYSAVIVVYIIFIGSISYYFKKKSTVPFVIPRILSVTLEFIDMIPQPFAFAAIFHLYSLPNATSTQYVEASIILVCFTVMVFVSFNINKASIFFFPSSLPLIFQNQNANMMNLVSFMCGLAELEANTTNTIASYIAAVLVPVFCVLCCVNVLYFGIIINKPRKIILMASFGMSFVASIFAIVFKILKKAVPDYLIAITFLVFIIIALIYYFVENGSASRNLSELDDYEADPSLLSHHKFLFPLFHKITRGFTFSHHYCLSYNIFKDLIQQHPSNMNLIIIYAKLLVIYPEEFNQLSWIYHHLKIAEKRSTASFFVESQIQTILMRRESILSVSLKKKLAAIGQLTATAKLRMRNAWETILSGNMTDLESLFNSVYKSIGQLDVKFMYILNYHSNNQYAIMAYANYQKEILANIAESESLKEKVKNLQSGHMENVDQIYIFGRYSFPFLPLHPLFSNTKDNRFSVQNAIQLDDQGLMNNDLAQSLDSDEETQSRLRMSIDNIHLPSLRWTIFLHVLLLILFIGVPTILGISMVSYVETRVTEPTNLVSSISELELEMVSITAMVIHLIGERVNTFKDPCSLEYTQQDGSVSPLIGGSCQTGSMVDSMIEKIIIRLQEIAKAKITTYDTAQFTEALQLLFTPMTSYQVYSSETNYTIENQSLEFIIMDIVQNAITISKSPSLTLVYRHIFSFISNFQNYQDGLNSASDLMMDFLKHQTTSLSAALFYAMIVLCIVLPIIMIIVIFICAKWMSNQKIKVYSCFHALPKTILSKMIEKMNTQTDSRDDDATEKPDQVDVERLHIEEKTIAILRSGEMNSDQTKKAQIFFYTFILVVLTIANIVVICLWYMNSLSNYNQMTPQIHEVIHSFSFAYQAVISLNVLAIFQRFPMASDIVKPNLLKSVMDYFLTNAQAHFKVMTFGDPDEDIDPIYGFISSDSDKFRNKDCDVLGENLTSYQIMKCSDEISRFMKMLDLTRRVITLQLNVNDSIDVNSTDFNLLWFFSTENILGEIIFPLFFEVSNALQKASSKTKDEMVIESVVIFVIALIIVIIYCISLLKATDEVKMILYQLLHAPAQSILQSDYIMTILSGDFTTKARSGQAVDDAAFEEVAEHFPDGIAVIEGDQLTNMNKFANEFFGGSHEIPADVDFNYARGNFSKEFLLEIGEKSAIASIQKFGTKVYLIMKDNTNIKAMENELQAEKERHNELIKVMLPSKMADLILADNPNEAFSVQSATIAVISVPSATIDQLLDIHTKLSVNVQTKYATIASVDIVGSHLVASAGIFETVSQSERHANDAISFAVEALKTAKAVCGNDAETRIGVATGGPVYIGVIDIGRPFFEVCGETVEFAEEIAAKAPTNVVHTTRAVYELIYGRGFQIKERGEVNLGRFGTIVSYTVT